MSKVNYRESEKSATKTKEPSRLSKVIEWAKDLVCGLFKEVFDYFISR